MHHQKAEREQVILFKNLYISSLKKNKTNEG